MSPFAEFLDILLREGRAVLRGPPDPSGQDREAVSLLGRAFATYRLDVAGPLIDFDAQTALAGAALLQRACWFVVSRDEPDAELDRSLTMPAPPCSPASHLSADLVLRFLPQVHRRAKAHNPADRLTVLLADILRRWPLAGVLSDLDDGPSAPVTFDGHPGLLMLYAERLAQHEKSAWVPQAPGREYLELVYEELGKDPAELLRSAEALATTGRGETTDE
jgi:hypothetical protein